ncbi:SAM-dependent methyltransferase [Pseudomonadota bacterium]
MTATPNLRDSIPRYSIALISATALGYEILLMRLFSIIQWHHFAYMIISLALLGYGVSGTFLTLARERLLAHFNMAYLANIFLFGLSALICFLLAQQVPFNPEELLWDPQQPMRLLLIYLLLTLPFFFVANAIGLALSRFHQQVGHIYAADLLGAGLGSVLIIGLLFLLFPQRVLQVISVLGLGAVLLGYWELGMRARSRILLMLFVIPLPLLLPASLVEPMVSPYKGLSQMLRIGGVQVVEQHSSPLGLLSVIESPRMPLRHAPGLSLNATTEPPSQVGVFTDSGGMTVITQDRGEREAFSYLDQITSALPYHLAKPKQALLLGVGGGSDVQQALYHGVDKIDAVELNLQMVNLLREGYGDFSGNLYARPEVKVHIAEARGFVAASDSRYDLIQLALVDSFSASSAGLHALNESYLYTVEALQEYLGHLAPGGYLAISRWVKLPPRDTLKLFGTAVEALKRSGINEPEKRLILIRSWQTSTLLIKNGEVSPAEIETLRRFSKERAFDLAYYPGIKIGEANHYNRLQQPYFYEAAQALLGGQGSDYRTRYKFNIEPATDDRPYFFHFFKWDVLPEILALRGQGGFPLLEWGYLILVATLVQALLVSLLLILLPLFLKRREKSDGAISRWRVFLYFGAIGLAFLFLEIAFIQKFILFLSHPLYAVAVVLSAFLVFAGLGSGWSNRLVTDYGDRRVVGWAVMAICVLGGLFLFLPQYLFPMLIGLPDPVKIIISVVLIAPLAFFMGMPFPTAVARLGRDGPDLIPWAWGVNGCASVLSAVLATLMAIHLGFTLVVIAALLLYGLAYLAFPKAG